MLRESQRSIYVREGGLAPIKNGRLGDAIGIEAWSQRCQGSSQGLSFVVDEVTESLSWSRCQGGTQTLRTRLFPVNRQSTSSSLRFSQGNGPFHSRHRVVLGRRTRGPGQCLYRNSL